MKKFNLFLIFFMTTSRLVLGQMDINAVNKPVELLNSANEDIENGNYTDAVQKLLAAIRLEPKIREMYLSLNTACSHTNQISKKLREEKVHLKSGHTLMLYQNDNQ